MPGLWYGGDYLGTSPDAGTMQRLVLDCVRNAGVVPVLETPAGVEATRRRSPDGTDHLFLLNHTADEVAVDLGTAGGADLLDSDGSVVTDRLHLPPYGAAVLRSSEGDIR
jgi:beta-galactosidase